MADPKPTKISELPTASLPLSSNYFPIAGLDTGSHTYKSYKTSVENVLANYIHVANTQTVNMQFDPGSLTFSANTNVIPVNKGGTGIATTPPNGSVLIGNGMGYVVNPLSAGPGISIVNNPGQVGISAEQLLSLINQLSSDMTRIMDVPYARFAETRTTNTSLQITQGVELQRLLNATEYTADASFATNESNSIKINKTGKYRIKLHSQLPWCRGTDTAGASNGSRMFSLVIKVNNIVVARSPQDNSAPATYSSSMHSILETSLTLNANDVVSVYSLLGTFDYGGSGGSNVAFFGRQNITGMTEKSLDVELWKLS